MNRACQHHMDKYGVCCCPLIKNSTGFHFTHCCRDTFPHFPLPCGCSHGMACAQVRHGKYFSPLAGSNWAIHDCQRELESNWQAMTRPDLSREHIMEVEEKRMQLFLKGASLMGERLAKRRKLNID